MRTAIAVILILLAHASPVLGQSLQVGTAQYKIGMTLEEARKVASAADQSIEFDKEAREYYINESPGKSLFRLAFGSLYLKGGRVVQITEFANHGQAGLLFDMYLQYSDIVTSFSTQYGEATNEHVNSQYSSEGEIERIVISTIGDVWEVELRLKDNSDGLVLVDIRKSVCDPKETRF